MANKTEIIQLITYFQDFYGAEYKPTQVDMLLSMLSAADAGILAAARDDLCGALKWLPKPSEIKAAVEAVRASWQFGADKQYDFWDAMQVYDLCLKGRITSDELENTYEYQVWKRAQAHPADCPCKICDGTFVEAEWTTALQTSS